MTEKDISRSPSAISAVDWSSDATHASRDHTAGPDELGNRVEEQGDTVPEAESGHAQNIMDSLDSERPQEKEESIAPAELFPNVEKLASETWLVEETGIIGDGQELEVYRKQFQTWTDCSAAFREDLESLLDKSAQITTESQQTQEKLPDLLRDRIRTRQEGLDLTYKMLARLSERLPNGIEPPGQELPVIGEEGWRNLIAGEESEISAQSMIRIRLRDLASARYQVFIQSRAAAEKARSTFFRFLERQVLPVLDALDDGEENSAGLIGQLKNENPDFIGHLDSWLSTYEVLRQLLLKVLDRAGVQPIEVEVGTPIDYGRQEPFDVEADPSMKDEHVKSVIRKGYECRMDDNSVQLLRAAQVVAVKNPVIPLQKPANPGEEAEAPTSSRKRSPC